MNPEFNPNELSELRLQSDIDAMSELEKLRLKLAELEEAIALARGESCRANFKLLYLTDQRSDCLKQVAQLTLAYSSSPTSS